MHNVTDILIEQIIRPRSSTIEVVLRCIINIFTDTVITRWILICNKIAVNVLTGNKNIYTLIQ